MRKIIRWFQREPKRLVLLAVVGLFGIGIIISSLSFTNETSEQTPVISLPGSISNPGGVPGSNSDDVGVGVTDDIQLKLPSREDLLEGAERASTDHAMVLMRTYLSYDPVTTPREIVSDLRPLVSDELLEELAETLRARDWDKVTSQELYRVVEAQFIEIVEEKGSLPYVVEITVDIFDYTGGNFADTPTNREMWRITLEPAANSAMFIAVDMEKL